jgi:multiple sugar transport system permease protein
MSGGREKPGVLQSVPPSPALRGRGDNPEAASLRRRVSASPRRLFGRLALYLVLFAGAFVFLIPFAWMVVTSLKTGDQVMTYPPQWVPKETRYYLRTGGGRVEIPPPLSENTRAGVARVKAPGDKVPREVPLADVERETRVSLRWSNYAETWRTVPFAMFTKNTLILAVLTVFGTTLSACLVAFGFARIQFPGREALFGLMLSTMMLPGIVTMIPGYILFRELGWIDTLKPLWVPAFFGGGAFNVFLLRQFFRTIPTELDEAAKIDGASWLGIFWRVVLPLTGPAVTTVALFTFIGAWKDFMGPLIFINSLEKQTLELGLQTFQTLYGTHWELMMAGAVIVVLPLILIFFLGQRLFIQGIVMTGLKG